MRRIAAIPLLRMLMAQGTVATDEGFAALSRSRTIKYIWGRECPNLTGLSGLPRLREISLQGSPGVTREVAALFPAKVRVSYSG